MKRRVFLPAGLGVWLVQLEEQSSYALVTSAQMMIIQQLRY